MHVLHVAAPGGYGGLERVVQSLALAQRDAGHQVTVAAITQAASDGDAFLAPLAARGIGVRRVARAGASVRDERRALAAHFREAAPDVVHTHGTHVEAVAIGGVESRGAAFVSTAHGFVGGGVKNRFAEWVQRRALRAYDAVIAVSAPLAKELVRGGVPSDRVRIVPNAWRPRSAVLDRAAARRTLGVPAVGVRVGWVGRVEREKGPDLFVRAIAALSGTGIAASVVGDGTERAAAERLAVQIGAAPWITWHGAVPDAERLLPAFDVIVLSSRSEGTPMILFEAMGAGVPVVATAVGGVPDVVSSREAALVPDHPMSIAAAICEVLADRAESRERVERARERVERRYAVGPWVSAYDAAYTAAQRRHEGAWQ